MNHLTARQTQDSTQTSTPVSSFVLQRKCACGQHTMGGGECEGCGKKQIQRQASGQADTTGVPRIVSDVLRSPGRPLDATTRTFMEQRFEQDFSHVRVHTDAKAAESARAVNAKAYTFGRDVVFGAGQYSTGTSSGQRLLAHELTHVVQQGGRTAGVQPKSITDSHDPTEREADSAAQAVSRGQRPRIALRSTGTMLHRDKDDLVAYSGGQSGSITVIQAKKIIYVAAAAVSGHPGHGENEPSEGPIPTGTYVIHPAITKPTVSKIQSGVCGAAGINSGYQEITSNDPSPCEGGHYCNIACPTTAKPAQKCFTPVDCWGPKRLKIEGSATVTKPGGGKVVRDGFYLHGGNPSDAVSSGCVKALNNDVFTEIRKLKGAVQFCVGTACPAWFQAGQKMIQNIGAFIGSLFGL